MLLEQISWLVQGLIRLNMVQWPGFVVWRKISYPSVLRPGWFDGTLTTLGRQSCVFNWYTNAMLKFHIYIELLVRLRVSV